MDLYAVNITDSEVNPILESKTDDLFVPSSTVHFIGMSGGRLMFNQNLTRESAYNLEPEKPMG